MKSLRDMVQNRGRIGDAGRASEKRLARKLGGRQTPASGAMPGAKGDIRLEDHLVEAKSTTAASFSLKFATLAKIAHEAQGLGKVPALTISFTDNRGKAIPAGEWVVLPLWAFETTN